jgi:hypothetical protein
VIRFAYRLDSQADKMVHASDPAEAALVRDAIVRGFYDANSFA